MRAIALATAVLIALAMSATPTLAKDRTVQPRAEELELETLSAWVGKVERAWLGFVLPGAGGLVAWTPVIQPDNETVTEEEAAEMSADDLRSRVILEDGAPF